MAKLAFLLTAMIDLTSNPYSFGVRGKRSLSPAHQRHEHPKYRRPAKHPYTAISRLDLTKTRGEASTCLQYHNPPPLPSVSSILISSDLKLGRGIAPNAIHRARRQPSQHRASSVILSIPPSLFMNGGGALDPAKIPNSFISSQGCAVGEAALPPCIDHLAMGWISGIHPARTTLMSLRNAFSISRRVSSPNTYTRTVQPRRLRSGPKQSPFNARTP
ncbi:hypothetical protein NMY22_g5899 [Coprinellus aureogranulatus]|nr:hypothetical protein NMY22_g5899 [Coprinellus aureogranulatus]